MIDQILKGFERFHLATPKKTGFALQTAENTISKRQRAQGGQKLYIEQALVGSEFRNPEK